MATLDLATILKNAALRAAAVPGMAGASGVPLDSVPKTPWTVFGMPKGTLSAGQWEMHELVVPMRTYFALTKDWPRVMGTVLPFINAVLATFRTDIDLGGSVTQCLIASWDLDAQATVAGEDYQLIDWELAILVMGSATYAV